MYRDLVGEHGWRLLAAVILLLALAGWYQLWDNRAAEPEVGDDKLLLRKARAIATSCTAH
ncbi:hypothetical protein [Streptomyces sp. NEAU-YJ-81]|uniref:hypothetical protein n=1 Tax=Streptomyces sp. NEAU-YJ-81 TaxID=2820288 RepID=UPI001ABD2999|nr:hypothetical protein [Streptomyces sp. NEAU-YJ-81]MBO3681672.1 hypothetical protein [Streptomyces sp. NEAU-YJ-81]